MIANFFALSVMILYILSGLAKGLHRMIIEFIIVIADIILSYFFFKITYSPIFTLVFFIAVAIVFPIIAKKIFAERFNFNIHLTSRLLGACLGSVWGLITLVLFFTFVRVIPKDLPYAQEVFDMVKGSSAYNSYLKSPILSDVPMLDKLEYMSFVLKDKNAQEKIKASLEFQHILEDPQLKALLEDEKLKEYLTERKYSEVMANPKIYALINDGALLEDFMEIDLKKIVESK